MTRRLALKLVIGGCGITLLVLAWIVGSGANARPEDDAATGASSYGLDLVSAERALPDDGLDVSDPCLRAIRTVVGQGPAIGGRSCRCKGKVVRPDGGGVADIAVELGVLENGVRRRTAEARSDRDGRFDVDVPIPDESLVGGEYGVFARIAEAGFQKPTGRRYLVDPDSEADFELPLARGGTISGRVLDREGRLAPRSMLELVGGGRGASGEERIVSSTLAWRGEFDLHFRDDGVYRVRVRARGTGNGSVEGLALKQAEDLEALDVVASSPDFLVGTVADERGEPLAHVEVRATPPAQSTSDADDFELWTLGPDAESDGADRWGMSKTDAKGVFRIEGLASGTYVVATRSDSGAPKVVESQWLGFTGATGIRLVRNPAPVSAASDPREGSAEAKAH